MELNLAGQIAVMTANGFVQDGPYWRMEDDPGLALPAEFVEGMPDTALAKAVPVIVAVYRTWRRGWHIAPEVLETVTRLTEAAAPALVKVASKHPEHAADRVRLYFGRLVQEMSHIRTQKGGDEGCPERSANTSTDPS